MSDPLLTPGEAAARMGVSRSLIYKWVAQGRLSHYRLGGEGRRGKIMVSPRDADSLMDSLRVEAFGRSRRRPA